MAVNPAVTKAWAETQDRILRGEDSPDHLITFETVRIAQEAITPTNLTFRHCLIASGTTQSTYYKAFYRTEAEKQFFALRRDGMWLENRDYWEYTLQAIRWYRERGNFLSCGMASAVAHAERAYAGLQAPDGSWAYAECSEAKSEVGTLYHSLTWPSHRVLRWFDDKNRPILHISVSLDADPDPRKNLHYHLEAGYVNLWTAVDGWMLRARPYKGFDLARCTASSDLADTLPPGALLPTWRAKPPKITVEEDLDRIKITWDNGRWWPKTTRTVLLADNHVKVVDRWGFFGVKTVEVARGGTP